MQIKSVSFGTATSTPSSTVATANSSNPIISTAAQTTTATLQGLQPSIGFSLASSSQPQPSLGLQMTQPSMGGVGGVRFQATSTSAPSTSLATVGGGQQTLAGIFSAAQAQGGASTQLTQVSSAPLIFGAPSQPTTSAPSLSASGTGLSFSIGTNPFPSGQPSQGQGQAQLTSLTGSVFGAGKLSVGAGGGGGGLFQTATSQQSQTFNFTGATPNKAGALNPTSQTQLLSGATGSQPGLTFNFSGATTQSGGLGAPVGQSGSQSTGGGGLVPTFNFTAGANGASQPQGLFASGSSNTGLTFNLKPGPLGAGQPQTQGQQQMASASGSGLTLPAPGNTIGQSTGFNFSAGLASGQAKPSFNFTAGTDQARDNKGASMFNFTTQTNSAQPMQGNGGLFNQPQGNSGGGLFNQTQASGGLFNQTQSNGLFNQPQMQNTGLFNQMQAQGGGGLFNQTQQSQGQLGSVGFNFGGTPHKSNIFGAQTGGQDLAFGASFQTPQQPQPHGKLSFTPTPNHPAANPPTFGAGSPSVSFTAGTGNANKGRPIARARRRTRK